MTLKRVLAIFLAMMMLFSTACEKRRDKPDVSQPSVSSDQTSTIVPPEESTGTETEPGKDESTDSQTEPEPSDSDSTEPTDPDSTESDSSSSLPTLGFFLPQYGEYYYDLTNVVLYLDLYGELPPNYITKAEAQFLGWQGGSVEPYLEGGAIGGDFYGNYNGALPSANGRFYTECDIDTDLLANRGSKRLVFSNDGLYFYTSDHYASFSEVIVTEDYEVIW